MQISPEIYKRMASQHARLKSMKQGQFVQWAVSFWQSAYEEGLTAAGIPEDAETFVMDEEELLDILLSVKGIGKKRADEILQKIL